MTGRTELEERRDQALRDLAELRRQVADGEVDPGAADRLAARYEADAAAALEALARLGGGGTGAEGAARHDLGDAPDAAGEARGGAAGRHAERSDWRRRAAGVLAVAALAAAAAVALPREMSPRPAGGYVSGNEVGGGRDLASVTEAELEEVVAANPDIVGMRLALARRYFEQGEFARALDHYREVLDREAHPEALAYVGWILFTSTQETDAAARFELESLERDPGNPLATWFLANIRLYGLDDPAGAATLARELLGRGDLPAENRAAVEKLLAEAERRAEADR